MGRQKPRGTGRIANNMRGQTLSLDDFAALGQGHDMAGDLAHLIKRHALIGHELVMHGHKPLTNNF